MTKICLCASRKFRQEVREVAEKLEKLGFKVLCPNLLDKEIDDDKELPEVIQQLVYDHFRAINEVEILFVVNPTGYFGNSVKVEIGYAKGQGRKVIFLEKTNFPELDCLADEFMGINELDKLKTLI